MLDKASSEHERLLRENEALRARVEEAEETLRAIRHGEVDALVVSGVSGDRIFTLRGADQPYRVLVEEMKEGAVTLAPDGTVLYANRRFAEILGLPLAKVIAAPLPSFIAPADRMVLEALLQRGRLSGGEAEVSLAGTGDRPVPVYLAVSPFRAEGIEALCLVVTDLTEQKRTEAIIADQRLARAILDQAAEAIVVCDESGRIIRANQAAHRLCGRNPLLQPFEAAFPLCRDNGPGARGEAAGEAFHLASAVRGDVLHGIDVRLARDEADSFILLLSAGPLLDGEGRAPGWVVTLTDITEHKRAEAALRESEATSRGRLDEIEAIYRNAPVGLGVLDPELRFVRINERLAEFNGVPAAAHIGRTVREIVPHAADEAEPLLRRVLETGEPILGLELTAETAARPGVLRTWLEHWVPLKDADGRVAGVNVVTEEVTERRQAEAALAAEKERLAVTLRSIADGVITTDVDGRVVLLNPVAERLTGWSQAEAAGRPIGDVFHIVHEFTRAAADDLVGQVLQSGAIVGPANHTALRSRDGTERVVADSGAPIRDPRGNVLGVVLVFRDITEKRRLDDELARAGKLESIGVLAGGIAHDFNNLLTGILANLSLAKLSVPPSEKLHRRLMEAEKASLRARELTQQLLTFAKGGAPIRKLTTLGGLLKEAAGFTLVGTNVRAEFDIPDDLWPAEVDAGQISQVIQNLVLNAQQAMPQGGTVRVRAEGMLVSLDSGLPLAEGRYLRLSIGDQGAGIPEEHLAKVFDPFFTTKPQGSGLGLATAYSIVHKHDGHLSVESKPGEGTTFCIYLPASARHVAPLESRPPGVRPGEGRVLVMDDEPSMRETVFQVLTALGYEVSLAADGREAVELYRQAMAAGTPFRAAILDLTVPGGMGGRETLRQLLAVDPQVRAIVSSGYSNDPVMSDFSSYGFRGVVAKPYSVEELSHVVHSVINIR